MKFKKIIIYTIAVLLGIIFIIPLVLSSHYHFEQSIVIHKPIAAVFNNVKSFKNWTKWGPWQTGDPSATYAYLGTDGHIGSTITWQGQKVGVGSNYILELQDNKYLKNRLVFKKPFENTADDIWKFDSTDMGTRVTWIDEMPLSYPFGRLMGLFMDKMLRKDFETGLKNLKEVSEKE